MWDSHWRWHLSYRDRDDYTASRWASEMNPHLLYHVSSTCSASTLLNPLFSHLSTPIAPYSPLTLTHLTLIHASIHKHIYLVNNICENESVRNAMRELQRNNLPVSLSLYEIEEMKFLIGLHLLHEHGLWCAVCRRACDLVRMIGELVSIGWCDWMGEIELRWMN